MRHFYDIFKSARGAIDLATIMVGLIVAGVLTAGVSATVYAVIPWTQDKAAKADLQAMKAPSHYQFGGKFPTGYSPKFPK